MDKATQLRNPAHPPQNMPKPHPSLLQSFKIATNGFKTALKGERNLKIIATIALLVTLGSFLPLFTTAERLALIISAYTVLALELLNTAVEKIVDLFHPGYGKEAGVIKDIAASAVWIASLGAILIGLVIAFNIINRLFF